MKGIGANIKSLVTPYTMQLGVKYLRVYNECVTLTFEIKLWQSTDIALIIVGVRYRETP